jgi:hypothetical protein
MSHIMRSRMMRVRARRYRPLILVAVLATLLLATLLLALPCPAALANDTMVGGIGGDVYPLSSADIRMESETVQAVCYREFAEYRVDFTFVNEGEPQTVKLGFPFVITSVGEMNMGEPPVAFRAWQDGRPLAVTLGRGVSQDDLMTSDDAPGYFLHEATFPRGKTVITVSYLARPTVSAGSRFGELAPPDLAALGIYGWSAHHDYWVHTGTGWKGTIGKAVIRFTLADSFDGWAVDVREAEAASYSAGRGNTTKPESYVKLDDRTYQWVFEDFEPTEADDVRFSFTIPYFWADTYVALPEGYGAIPTTGGASERLGPNREGGMSPGWEAMDGSLQTAWGFSAPGTGWIGVEVVGDQDLQEIRILPGRHDSPDSFYEYGRPKTLSVAFNNTSTIVTLEDEPGLQRFPVPAATDRIRLTVLEIYPGTKSDDTYITEIDLGTESAPAFEEPVRLVTGQGMPSTTTTVTTATSGGVTTSIAGASLSGSTSSTSGSSATATSPSSTGTAATTTTGSGTDPEQSGGSERTLWPAYVGIAVALIAVGVLVMLVRRLRRTSKGS